MDIYVLVEPTLPPGLKCAQVAHAVSGLVFGWNDLEEMEAAVDGRMIVLDGNPSLLEWSGLTQYTFHEPDLDDQATATAFLVPPTDLWRFSPFPLAYKEKQSWLKKKLKAIIAQW